MTRSVGALICLLSDFGLDNHFVGVVKGVLLEGLPDARLVDVTHGVPPQDIRQGAFELLAAASYFPTGAFFLCIVDPGVGTGRRVVYAESRGRRFLGPDNGLLSWAVSDDATFWDLSGVVTVPAGSAQTFHGRDVFAPLAVKLLAAENPAALGPVVADIVRLPFPVVSKAGSKWTGEIIAVDRFGNLVTNFRTSEVAPLAERSRVWFDVGASSSTVRGLASTYAAAEKGRLVAVGGSSGFVELAVRDGNARQSTGLGPGSRVSLEFRV